MTGQFWGDPNHVWDLALGQKQPILVNNHPLTIERQACFGKSRLVDLDPRAGFDRVNEHLADDSVAVCHLVSTLIIVMRSILK